MILNDFILLFRILCNRAAGRASVFVYKKPVVAEIPSERIPPNAPSPSRNHLLQALKTLGSIIILLLLLVCEK